VNGKTIAIFKHFGRLYAINNVCPHQRGELHLGDIEEIDKSLCVSCPRHHWPFSLKDGSCSVGVKYQAEVFPVQIRTLRDGRDVIFVGFPSFTRTLFNDDDF
jgi:nitrite reductase/ring-hydroxylating ferredoxin subunit